MKAFRPLFLIVSLVLIVGLACSLGGPAAQPTKEPTDIVTQPTDEPQQPTDEPEPTDEAVPTEEDQPTDTPEPSGGDEFFTDTFDSDDIDNYTIKYLDGKGLDSKADIKAEVSPKNGYLVFDINSTSTWPYATYTPHTYKDVKISLIADNRGKNNNNISLVCRKSDEGWYEFNIANSGLYNILVYISADKAWHNIYNGGSTAIKQGKDTNEYVATCIGTELSLTINGVEAKKIKDNKYRLRDGNVGFGVSSFNVIPILVNIDEFTVSEP